MTTAWTWVQILLRYIRTIQKSCQMTLVTLLCIADLLLGFSICILTHYAQNSNSRTGQHSSSDSDSDYSGQFEDGQDSAQSEAAIDELHARMALLARLDAEDPPALNNSHPLVEEAEPLSRIDNVRFIQ